MKLAIIIVGAGIAVAAGVVAWRAGRAAREAESTRVRLIDQHRSIERTLQRTEASLAAAETQAAGLRTRVASLPDAKPESRRPDAPAVLTSEEKQQKLEAEMRAAESPAEQVKRLASRRAGLLPTYRQFFERKKLSAAQIERFLEIAIKRAEADMDISALVTKGMLASSDPAVAKFKAEAKDEQDRGYRELLGEAGFQELQEVWRIEVARDLVKGLAGMTVVAGAPAFTATQLEDLVRIVANADRSYRAGGRVSYTLDTIDWDVVETQARPLMSDAQWAVYKGATSPLGYDWGWSRVLGAIAKAKHAETANETPRTAPRPRS